MRSWVVRTLFVATHSHLANSALVGQIVSGTGASPRMRNTKQHDNLNWLARISSGQGLTNSSCSMIIANGRPFTFPGAFSRMLLLNVIILLNGCGPSLGDKLVGAAANGDISEIKKLIKQGADINYKCHSLDASTPLIWAIRQRQLKVVEFLIESGADLNVRCGTGQGVLFWATGDRHDDTCPIMIKELILAGTNIEIDGKFFEGLPVNDPNRIAFQQAIALKIQRVKLK